MSKGASKNCFWSNEASALLSETTVPTDNTKYNCHENVANNFTELTIYKGYSRGQFDNIVAYKTLFVNHFFNSARTEFINMFCVVSLHSRAFITASSIVPFVIICVMTVVSFCPCLYNLAFVC